MSLVWYQDDIICLYKNKKNTKRKRIKYKDNNVLYKRNNDEIIASIRSS